VEGGEDPTSPVPNATFGGMGDPDADGLDTPDQQQERPGDPYGREWVNRAVMHHMGYCVGWGNEGSGCFSCSPLSTVGATL
jgi:malate synthase